jgi:hypothetical protein
MATPDAPEEHFHDNAWLDHLPDCLDDVWDELPLEVRIGAYVVAEDAAQFAKGRDDID